MSFWRRFLEGNIAVCESIERLLPAAFTINLLAQFRLRCYAVLAEKRGMTVIDVGGGHMCTYASNSNGAEIFGCDILYEQLRANPDIRGGFVTDVTVAVPVRDNSVDLLTSRSVVEHLNNNRAFFKEVHRVLRPGGTSIHVFPCRYAPFAVLNRVLPNRLTKWLIATIFPMWSDECGFRAYYDSCYPSQMSALVGDSGLTVRLMHLRYYQSIYFKFFVPLYLLSLFYDLVVWRIGIKTLACQMLLIVEKPA